MQLYQQSVVLLNRLSSEFSAANTSHATERATRLWRIAVRAAHRADRRRRSLK